MMTLDKILTTNPSTTIKKQGSPHDMDQGFVNVFQNQMNVMKNIDNNPLARDKNNKINTSLSEKNHNRPNKIKDESPKKTQKEPRDERIKFSKDDKKTLENKDIDNELESTETENENIPYEILMLLQNSDDIVKILNELQNNGYLEGEIEENFIPILGELLDIDNLEEGTIPLLHEISNILVKEEINIEDLKVKLNLQDPESTVEFIKEPINPPLELTKSIEDLNINKEDNFEILNNRGEKTENFDLLEEEMVFSDKIQEKSIEPKVDMDLEVLVSSMNNNIQITELPETIEDINNLSTINPVEILEQIVQHVEVVYKEGKNQIKLQLYPENLGKMSIDLVSDNNQIKAKVYVDSLVVKEVIENNLNDFRESLKDKGINITQIDVSVGQDPETYEKARDHQHRLQNRRRISDNMYNSISALEGIEKMVNTNPYIVNTNFDKTV